MTHYTSNNVSGGQRQLIIMAAVAASSVPILLLDEPFSMLDTLTVQRLVSSPALRHRTVVYASHREMFKGEI